LTPTTGEIWLGGQDLAQLNGEPLRAARQTLGLIGQHAALVRRRSVIANVTCGALARNRTIWTNLGFLPAHEIPASHVCLDQVGLPHLAAQRAGNLSGGQAQRVAIGRALIARPQALFADEPTGSLDSVTGRKVMDLMTEIAREEGTTVVLVTHDAGVAGYADRQVTVTDGRVGQPAAVGGGS
jgi:phosphonate transport system ATP-binding protein